MRKYRSVPALIIALIFVFVPKPKPSFDLFGMNWLMCLMVIVWLVLVIRDFRAEEQTKEEPYLHSERIKK